MLNFTDILGVHITCDDEQKILDFIEQELRKPKSNRRKIVIFTPNPEQISAAQSNPSLKNLLNRADIALPDGIGVVAGAKLLGKSIRGRITGVDFMKKLVKSISKRPVVTGYFGGQVGVAEETWKCLQKTAFLEAKKQPEMTLGYASHLFDRDKMIHSDIDILFVALGFPKQEEWILKHKEEIPATVFMAVGGAFDFISGRVPRAPGLIRNLGLEWLFRLILDPSRFGRQLRIWHFGVLIFKEALINRLKLKKSN